MGAATQELREQLIDRYAIYDKIAAGGMAVVHLGRLLGQAGFSRTVAIKRLHPQFATDPEFVAMFLDEAHLAVRVQHPNVVAPLDVVVTDGELLVVMEYVSGETLAQLMRAPLSGEPSQIVAVLSSIMVGTLYGLHAAHEALGENGQPLNIVHRDVSPQNVIVGLDGIARVLDFGVAKAAMRSHATKDGEIKGKIAYMAPEQLRAEAIDRRADVFAAGVVFWETLTGRRLFRGDDLAQTVDRVLHSQIQPPSKSNPAVSSELDQVVLRALDRDPSRRFATAREFAAAIERVTPLASVSEVGDWVKAVGGSKLAERVERVTAIENHSSNRLRIGARSAMATPHLIEADPRLETGSRRVLAPTERTPAPTAAGSQPGHAEPEPAQRAAARRVLGLPWPAAAVAGGSLLLAAIALSHALGAADAAPKASAAPLTNQPPAASSLDAVRAAPQDGAQPANAAPQASSPPLLDDTASTPASAAVGKPASVRHPSLKPSKPSSAPAASKRADCDPPFFIDEKRIRRIKPGCLQ